MLISKIIIKNFRSIINLEQNVKDLNIFVGQNDEGKSNILRALDLFFNHEKRYGYDLDWSRDYCYFAPVLQRKAQEITIEVVITPPANFRNQKAVVWKKTWRKEGFHKELVRHTDRTEISARSKIFSFLKVIRYDYVPAIKGEDYFRKMMSALHDILEATVEEQIRSASGTFTKTINKNTKSILKEISERLGLDTTIELPPNLREIFAQLEFTSLSDERPFSLNQRGDGIKVRHVPIVLRWLAEQVNHLSSPGRPKAMTIWGYEEPENNLELRKCFELANEFVENAQIIQTFITTHSPAFYSVCRNSDQDKVGLFLVTKGVSPPTTTVSPVPKDGLDSVDSSMGLLDLLAPHFTEAQSEIERLRNAAIITNVPTIFVEGRSDKSLLELAMNEFFPNLVDSVSIATANSMGGGHTWVRDQLIAWSHCRPEKIAVGLFDKDDDAQISKRDASSRIKSSERNTYAEYLVPSDELKACYSKGIPVPFAIEELLPESVWCHAQKSNWLEDRTNPIATYNFTRTDIPFAQFFEETLEEDHLRRIALKKVKLFNKKDLCNYVKSLTGESRTKVLSGLKPTLTQCLQKLGMT